jgi:small subunit ribosomal protein S21
MIQVKLKRGEPVERALKRLKKIMDKEGMMKQLRSGRFFEKPSEKKRKKSARARTRLAQSM